jgi:hypothetical protein
MDDDHPDHPERDLVISSKCGVYMNVPAFVNVYRSVGLAGRIASA